VTPPAAAASTVHRARVAAPPRPRVAPPSPRRISGPLRQPTRRPAPATQPSTAVERGLVLGVLEAIASLSSHRALDRLIRGRIWIALIAFALIGIVMLQLLVLQLNANMGRALVREAQLQRENAALSIEGSELAGGERVESKAARLGMQLVPMGSLRFLTSYPPADIARAAAALNTPVHTATTTSSGEASSSGASAGAATRGAGAASTSASGEQAPSGEQASSSEQAASGEQAPTGEASAPALTSAATSPSAEAAPTSAATSAAGAPATAAGGTEPTGTG